MNFTSRSCRRQWQRRRRWWWWWWWNRWYVKQEGDSQTNATPNQIKSMRSDIHEPHTNYRMRMAYSTWNELRNKCDALVEAARSRRRLARQKFRQRGVKLLAGRKVARNGGKITWKMAGWKWREVHATAGFRHLLEDGQTRSRRIDIVATDVTTTRNNHLK